MANNGSGLTQRFKGLIPNNIKQEGKYFLMNLLKMPYSRSAVPLEILNWLPKSNPIVFFDIGANVGHFSKSICGEYKIKNGVLIEPVSKIIPVLNEEFPDKEIFHIINAAVSDSILETEFYYNDDAHFVSSLLRIDNKGDAFAYLGFEDPILVKVQALTLDYIVNDLKIANIDLIKMDVQGAEHLVLKGGEETLKKTRLVYTEFSFKPVYQNSSTFFDLYKIFYENDFILVNITGGFSSPNGELIQGDALFINKNMMN